MPTKMVLPLSEGQIIDTHAARYRQVCGYHSVCDDILHEPLYTGTLKLSLVRREALDSALMVFSVCNRDKQAEASSLVTVAERERLGMLDFAVLDPQEFCMI